MRAAKMVVGKGSATTGEWLESPVLKRVAARARQKYHLATADLADLEQEIRIALWQAGLELRVGPAWVFRVARNKAIDLRRRRRRVRALDQVLAATSVPADHHEELDHLLHAKVDDLSPRLHEVYGLHYLEGFSEREIARRLGICPPSSLSGGPGLQEVRCSLNGSP